MDELRSAMSGDDPRVVHLSGMLSTGSEELEVNSNKTLRGTNKDARIVGGISIRGNNVILQNFTIEGAGDGGSPDDALNSHGASNLWLDHLAIFEGPDGMIDLTNGSDLATVSWCKFWYNDPDHGHRLALLFGNGSTKCEVDGGKQNHTIHHNWFAELVRSRAPRLLFGKGHIYNNFYNTEDNNYCIGIGSWGSGLIEYNYFKDTNDPHQHQDHHPSYIATEGNIYDNTDGAQDEGYKGMTEDRGECDLAMEDPGPWTPPYPYELDPAESIPDLVMRCAGPQ
jgi:pectate lyase